MLREKEVLYCFRLLSELYSLLLYCFLVLYRICSSRFPSPLGVIFSLMLQVLKNTCNSFILFSFRLLSELYSLLFIMYIMIENNISFRLLSELYSLLGSNKEIIQDLLKWVSVSSRSYILSYVFFDYDKNDKDVCFRLLSELYSLL